MLGSFVFDRKVPSWLSNLKNPSGKLAHWSIKLRQHSFELIYRKGHVVPDALSRMFQNNLLSPFLEVDTDWIDL